MKHEKEDTEIKEGLEEFLEEEREEAEKKIAENLEKTSESEPSEKEDSGEKMKKMEAALKEKEDILSKKEEEIASLKDTMLRRQADFENFKKRVVKNAESDRKLAIKDFAIDVMKIQDDLLRASESALTVNDVTFDQYKAYIDGVLMVAKNIQSAFEKYNIKEIEAEGQEFNPAVHEAVEIDMSDDVECDTVTRVYQKGFMLDEFVLRSAKVKVTKPMPKQQ